MQQRQMTLINDWQIFVGHCPNLNKDYADHSGVAYSRLNKSVRVPEVKRKKMFFQQNTGNTTQRNNLLIIISTKPQMGFSRVYVKNIGLRIHSVYQPGKPGNLKEFLKPGILREISGNFINSLEKWNSGLNNS